MSLSVEVRDNYVTIIDSILAKSDLSTVSEKRIRKGIQEKVEYDITPQKAAIVQLIMERFDHFVAQQTAEPEPEPEPLPSVETKDAATASQTNGKYSPSASPSVTSAKREPDQSDSSSDVVDDVPPKKKRKTSTEDDAAIAARLQAEENRLSRPSRATAPRKAAVVKKKHTPKKKTSQRVTGSDDSDINDQDHPKRKVNRDTGFHKPLNLSPALSDLFGETSLSRPQVTKRIWQYIKANDLQNPSDKRYILCDDRLKDVFKQDTVHMFTMTKLLSAQMYAPGE